MSDCDGTVCGGELCRNGGECSVVEQGADFECACAEPFVGRTCTEHQLCSGSRGCNNGGECSVKGEGSNEDEVRCHCPLGFAGDRCQNGSGINKELVE